MLFKNSEIQRHIPTSVYKCVCTVQGFIRGILASLKKCYVKSELLLYNIYYYKEYF